MGQTIWKLSSPAHKILYFPDTTNHLDIILSYCSQAITFSRYNKPFGHYPILLLTSYHIFQIQQTIWTSSYPTARKILYFPDTTYHLSIILSYLSHDIYTPDTTKHLNIILSYCSQNIYSRYNKPSAHYPILLLTRYT